MSINTDGYVTLNTNGYYYIAFTVNNGTYITFSQQIDINYVMIGGGGAGGAGYLL
jgi:hypothetical protein